MNWPSDTKTMRGGEENVQKCCMDSRRAFKLQLVVVLTLIRAFLVRYGALSIQLMLVSVGVILPFLCLKGSCAQTSLVLLWENLSIAESSVCLTPFNLDCRPQSRTMV